MKIKTCKMFGRDWKVEGDAEQFEIEVAEMYERPEETNGGLTFSMLQAISDHFGTTLIDVGDVNQGGCETCDYGSLYGLRIIVRDAKKGIDAEVATIEAKR